jgi:NADPH:quinone reductase-like Zn-dependent oxidoreductase
MRAMRFTDASSATLMAAEMPRPTPGRDEILIRVVAAGITPAESGWYPTSHTKDGKERKGAVPAHEFSGVVEAVGESVVDRSAGDEVYGMND